jgi:hypothetical protein
MLFICLCVEQGHYDAFTCIANTKSVAVAVRIYIYISTVDIYRTVCIAAKASDTLYTYYVLHVHRGYIYRSRRHGATA